MQINTNKKRTLPKLGFAKAILLAACCCLLGCAQGNAVRQAQQAQPAPTPTPARLTEKDLMKLRWIEGTWRGTGDGQAPFFERYRFESGTTLIVETFADETLAKVTDTSRTSLRDGQFSSEGDGPRWAATELTDDAITFHPVARARNSFRWQKRAGGGWEAVLNFPATNGRPAQQRVYRMEPWPPTK